MRAALQRAPALKPLRIPGVVDRKRPRLVLVGESRILLPKRGDQDRVPVKRLEETVEARLVINEPGDMGIGQCAAGGENDGGNDQDESSRYPR